MTETNDKRVGGGADAPITPVRLQLEAHEDGDRRTGTTGATQRLVVVTAALVLFVVTLSVIFVLPRYVASPASAPAPVPAADAGKPAGPEPLPADALDEEETATLRRTNQAQLERLLGLVERLKARHVTAWASEEFAAAERRIGEGEKAYREQRYADADTVYQSAIAALEALEGRVDDVANEAVEEGFGHIAAGDASAARKAFESALAITPDHERAGQGLARAKTLDQVLALIKEAQGYEELGDTGTALSRYEAALALDAETPDVAAAIDRIRRSQREAAFRRAMSEGITAFDAGKDDAAKAAFARALKLKPDAPDAREALAQVENRILAERISRHLKNAARAERDEQWTQAATEYGKAAALDPDLDGASASATRAAARARLDAQIEAMMTDPRRLQADAVHKEALALLDRARAERDPGPRLREQISRLASTVELARTPVAVTVLSDNATEVTLYKVGALGRFDRREVSVIPGRYVAVGKRDGFRDVRVEFEITAKQSDPTVTVRCDQKLAFGS